MPRNVLTRVTIRRATAADATRLSLLRYRMRAELGTPREPQGRFIRRCAPWLRSRLKSSGNLRGWIALENKEPVGCIFAMALPKIPNPVAEPETHAYLTGLFVEPQHRGGGLGGRLLDRALKWTRQARADATLLWPSPKSVRLYRRRGFRPPPDLLQLRRESFNLH